MSELQWTVIDGVTTVWTQTPEPLHAQLIFRTGLADETLVTSGHTHLLEHLALEAVGDEMHRHNGFVSPLMCSFVTTGRPDEVSAFLLGITRALRALPAERLEAEKAVLEAEDASTPPSGPGMLLAWRYGAMGHGLTGLPQLGVKSATLQQLQSLSEQRFTRQNAVLWLSGPPPSGLRLELPVGHKYAPPSLVPLPQQLPGWIADDASAGIASGSIVPRNMASLVFRTIVTDRLHDELRNRRALSYSPAVRCDHLNAHSSHLVLYADSDPSRRAELAEAFGQVFDSLSRVTDDEVRRAREQLCAQWSGSLAPHPDERRCADAQNAAYDWLLDRKSTSVAELEAECATVAAAQVADFAEQVKRTAIIALPGDTSTGLPWMGTQIAVSTVPPVTGRELRAFNPLANPARLVAGAEGVTLHLPNGFANTVRYGSLAAVLRFDDGSLHLIGSDGLFVAIDPTEWRDGHAACQEVLRSVPPHLLLNRGPAPATPDDEDIPAPPRASKGQASPAVSVALAIAGGLGALFSLLTLGEAFQDPELMTGDIVEIGMTLFLLGAPFVVCVAMLIVGVRRLTRR